MVDWFRIVEVASSLGVGGLLMASGRWLGRRLDLPVLTLQVENQRLRDALEKLGKKYDDLEARTVAVAVRARQDSMVDDAFVDDLPTGVRDRTDIIAPKKSDPPLHPDTTRDLRKYTSGGESTPPDPHPIMPGGRGRK